MVHRFTPPHRRHPPGTPQKRQRRGGGGGEVGGEVVGEVDGKGGGGEEGSGSDGGGKEGGSEGDGGVGGGEGGGEGGRAARAVARASARQGVGEGSSKEGGATQPLAPSHTALAAVRDMDVAAQARNIPSIFFVKIIVAIHLLCMAELHKLRKEVLTVIVVLLCAVWQRTRRGVVRWHGRRHERSRSRAPAQHDVYGCRFTSNS